MPNAENKIDDARKKTQSTPLRFPRDGSIENQSTMITLTEYKRGNPKEPPQLINFTSIFLPLPVSGLEDNISLQYQDVPLGAAIGGLLSPGKNLASKIAGAALEYGRNALTTAAGIAGDAISPGLGAQAQNATNQGLGVATNPNMSLTFNGVDLRNHNFTWRLIAKSIQESLEIENIINTLKLNALPRKIVGAGFTLSYPAIAMLSFFPTNLIKISELGCFILSITVKYDGDGYPVFFKGEKPVIVDLSISFRERAILTADDYDKTQFIGS
jgi:hypothetical protein